MTVSVLADYDQYFTATALNATCTITGTWHDLGHAASPLSLTASITGTWLQGSIWSGDALECVASVTFGDYVHNINRRNVVQWSNIGSLDFTVWRDNVAGERPIPLKGWVHQLIKRGNRIIGYSENGVFSLIPAGTSYGLQILYEIGIKGKNAAIGTEYEHYFIDKENQLFKLGDSLEKLDYSEYLANLTSLVTMSHDKETGSIYICDGRYGYVYSPKDNSLGECSPYITGIGSQSGTKYVTAANILTNSAFEICTDIFDFGSRKGKTINEVHIGTDLTGSLYAAIEYRRDKSASWSTTDWRLVDASGKATVLCYGTEFRIKVKCATYEDFEIDYITINGIIHDN